MILILITTASKKINLNLFNLVKIEILFLKQVRLIKMNENIVFNSKSKSNYQLSNFYGDVEICYMKSRFQNKEIINLFDDFKKCDNDKFIYYLKLLQPEKKWSEKKLNYWFRIDKDGNKYPIRGILAKLLGTSVKDTPVGKKRLKIVKDYLNIKENIKINSELNLEEKKELMVKCLRVKFNQEPYRSILLSTGKQKIHEKPMRGSGDIWTYPGGNLLGLLLEKVRDEICL